MAEFKQLGMISSGSVMSCSLELVEFEKFLYNLIMDHRHIVNAKFSICSLTEVFTSV